MTTLTLTIPVDSDADSDCEQIRITDQNNEIEKKTEKESHNIIKQNEYYEDRAVINILYAGCGECKNTIEIIIFDHENKDFMYWYFDMNEEDLNEKAARINRKFKKDTDGNIYNTYKMELCFEYLASVVSKYFNKVVIDENYLPTKLEINVSCKYIYKDDNSCDDPKCSGLKQLITIDLDHFNDLEDELYEKHRLAEYDEVEEISGCA